jgi:hypothetical protein
MANWDDWLARRREKLPSAVGMVGMGRGLEKEILALEGWPARAWRDALNAPLEHRWAYGIVSVAALAVYEGVTFPALVNASVAVRTWAGIAGVVVGPVTAFGVFLLTLLVVTPFRQRDEARAANEWFERRDIHGQPTYREVRASLEAAVVEASALREQMAACATKGDVYQVVRDCQTWHNRAGRHLTVFGDEYGKRWMEVDHFIFLPSQTDPVAAVSRLDAKVAIIKAVMGELDAEL